MNILTVCRILVITSFFAAILAAKQSPTPTEIAIQKPSGRKIVLVESSTKVIEEKTLNPDGGLATGQALGTSSRYSPGQTSDGLSDMQAELPTAVTYYKFSLLPKEELNLKLKCESNGKVYMQFVTPLYGDAMAAQFKRANMATIARRSSRIIDRSGGIQHAASTSKP